MKYSRKILYLLVFGLLTSCISQVALIHVNGSQGMAPALPPDVPGIDGPFPQDGEKFTFGVLYHFHYLAVHYRRDRNDFVEKTEVDYMLSRNPSHLKPDLIS